MSRKTDMANQTRIELLKKYISEEPGEPFNHYALALEYYESEPEQALKILKKLSQNNPNYLPTYYKLAHLQWETGQFDEAREVFKKGIELAAKQNDPKTLHELRAAFQNFEFDID